MPSSTHASSTRRSGKRSDVTELEPLTPGPLSDLPSDSAVADETMALGETLPDSQAPIEDETFF
jgi:hypothetical protein